jgi:BMFP domain-containing protein YqiC
MVNKAVEQAIKRRSNSPARAEFDELKKRFEDLETHVMDNSSSIAQAVEGDKESTARTVETAVQQSIQPQLDALNRAVRRYEKRAVTQAIQTEARMQQLELRIRDALALAELAARRSNSNGQLGSSPLVGLVGRVVTAPFSVMLALARWPFDTMRSVVQKAAAVVVGNEKKDRGRRRGKMDYPGGMRVTKMPRR